jgi:aspartyl-tRNA(Asn)/glutamyl-tRNA(Gln) amidotransferase subunit B
MTTGYEAVIGVEVHVQLRTRTKLFCRDLAEFGADPNTNVCPVCLGLPGALPVTNGAAVDLALTSALGLGCTVHETSVFARKNYFYPDLPKGYQITQFDRPLATAGSVQVEDGNGEPRLVRIRRIHMEEDAGKSLHDRFPDRTAIDLNRAGVPLIEIVTEPDIRSAAEARTFLNLLKRTLEYLDVSDCDMEKGSLRVDANVSVRRVGATALGTKTEIKNMNSFANVERAIGFEIERQSRVIADGGQIVHETLLWDAHRAEARPMRSKEESHDYRYFPEPDLPPLVVEPGRIDAVRISLPELPAAREARFRDAWGLPPYDAGVLTASRALAGYFEETATASADAKLAANWIMTDVLGWLNQRGLGIAAFPIAPPRLAALVRLAADGTVSSSGARAVFARMADGDTRSPEDIVRNEGLEQVRDDDAIARWVDEVILAHGHEFARLRNGEDRILPFLMGQVMKRSNGTADPRRATELLRGRASS